MSRFGNLELDVRPLVPVEPATSAPPAVQWLNDGWAAFQVVDFDTALRCFSRSSDEDPSSAAPWIGQIRALIELDALDRARDWAATALERFPEAPELLAAQAVALGRQGETGTARSLSDASLGGSEETPYLWLARADVLLVTGPTQALACLERAAQKASCAWTILWMAARVLRYHGHWASALTYARTAAAQAPGEFAVWLLCGECEGDLGLLTAARRSLDQARTLRPASPLVDAAFSRLNEGNLWTRVSRWYRRRNVAPA